MSKDGDDFWDEFETPLADSVPQIMEEEEALTSIVSSAPIAGTQDTAQQSLPTDVTSFIEGLRARLNSTDPDIHHALTVYLAEANVSIEDLKVALKTAEELTASRDSAQDIAKQFTECNTDLMVLNNLMPDDVFEQLEALSQT